MMIVMILTMLMFVVMKAAAVSARGPELDINPGVETNLCDSLEFGDTEVPSNIPSHTQCLKVAQTQIPRLSQGAFTRLKHLRKLIISGNVALTHIGAFAFSDLPELRELIIEKSKHLKHIHQDAFTNIKKLRRLTISSTGLRTVPNLSKIHSTVDDFILRLQENNHIKEVPAYAFRGLCNLTIDRIIISKNERLENITAFALAGHLRLTHIEISENVALTSIGAFAFSDLPELRELIIKKSKHLRYIHQDAFKNIVKLRRLTISSTGLRTVPNLSKIHSTVDDFIFRLQENNHIKEVPANAFRGLCTQTIDRIELTRNGIEEVASDAFNGTKMHALYLKGNKQLTRINANAFVGSSELVVLDISQTALSSLPEEYILSGLETLIAESAFNLKKIPPPQSFTELREANLTYSSHCCAFESLNRTKVVHPMCSKPEAQTEELFRKYHCSNSPIVCRPTQDEFNPCGDIMNAVPLRVLIWIISILALLGNTVVLLVLLGSRSKLTVPRFLMCHLAFSDLCMGIYLVVIATVDIRTRGQYYNDALDWQTGLGCSAAGFFTVFASELSVFTLTAITLERWHTITHALRLDRKLRLRHACVVMTVGWIFSSIAAFLPTVGVSSYGKVSICLPMDVESLESQVYVVSLLLLNILAFVCVCGCYLSIYLTVRNPSSAPAHADTRVAQRMAILIFTDFVCMAPISFFAVSAALKLPLISVSGAKLLLVLFYPINSCSNPFLYAFFTRTFRQDFFLLTARFGLFKTRAQIYRTESSSC